MGRILSPIHGNLQTLSYQFEDSQIHLPCKFNSFVVSWGVCAVCLVVSDSFDPIDCSLPGSSAYGILQGIFLTQQSNLGLLYCRQTLYQLSYKGSPTPIPNPIQRR